jgi:hypothetical protein
MVKDPANKGVTGFSICGRREIKDWWLPTTVDNWQLKRYVSAVSSGEDGDEPIELDQSQTATPQGDKPLAHSDVRFSRALIRLPVMSGSGAGLLFWRGILSETGHLGKLS